MRSVLLGACALIAATHLVLPAQRRPDVLLITLDTTRADRMGFLGSTRGLTPALDAFARTATVFERAYAQAPITTVSHATLLTGAYPPLHRVDDFGAPLPASIAYLPDLLKAQGYRTGAFVASLVLDPRNGTAPGFERGFDVYDAGFRLRQPGDDRYRTVERRGDEVTSRALAWLADGSRDPGGAPSFLWVHLFDAHDPYDPPADVRTRFAKDPYDGEIAFVDRQVGRMVSAAGGHTTIAVAADHGEALGDHGETTHGVFLYDATLRVPLLLRVAGGRGAGARVSARVRLADVAPTLLESLGVPVPASMQGQSLLPLIAGTTSAGDRPVYAESSYPRRAFGWSPLIAWREDRYLYVRAPRRELYDVVADSAASKNIAASRARTADGLDNQLAQFLRRSASAARPEGRVDPAVAARLSALGYVSGSAGAPNATGVDPKDRIAIANALHEAIVLVEDGAFARAAPLLEKVVAGEPDIPIAQLNLGVARARQRQYARAIPPLRRAAALQPENMRGHYELGLALYANGDPNGAADELAIVAAALPKWSDARYSLGSVYARIDRVPDALTELHAALALEPRHFRANLLMGRLLTLTGKAAESIPYLQAAVEIEPDSAEAKQFLAEARKRN
jgi:arylsulfatase A-like enzyme/Flp pilus assembly protein TadD